MTVVVLNFHYISPLNRKPLPLWIKRLAINESNLCSGLPASFNEYCSRYYEKAKSNRTTNCCSSTFEDKNVNEHKLDNHMDHTACRQQFNINTVDNRRANSANETGNWFESAYQGTPQKKHLKGAHQFDHQQSQQPTLLNKSNNNNNCGRGASKSKWMGQVDRLAASLFSGGTVVNTKTNKVHSSELGHAPSECTDAVFRKASGAASGHWGHSVGTAAAGKRTVIEKEALATSETGYYNCPTAKMQTKNGNSSAIQVCLHVSSL